MKKNIQQEFEKLSSLPNPFTHFLSGDLKVLKSTTLTEEEISELVYMESSVMGVVSTYVHTAKLNAGQLVLLRESQDFFRKFLSRLTDPTLDEHRVYLSRILKIIDTMGKLTNV